IESQGLRGDQPLQAAGADQRRLWPQGGLEPPRLRQQMRLRPQRQGAGLRVAGGGKVKARVTRQALLLPYSARAAASVLCGPKGGGTAMYRRAGLLVVMALWLGGSAAAAPGVLDLVPEDAAAALAVRNLNDLKKKGDKFAADAELQSLPRVSQL